MDNYGELMEELFSQLRRTFYASPEITFSGFLQGGMKILNYLYIHPGPVLPGELCEALYMTSARMSAALKSLNGKGYIERKVSETDRRCIPVILTQKGRDYYAGEKERLYSSYTEMFRKLGEEDTRSFIKIMRKLNDIALGKEKRSE